MPRKTLQGRYTPINPKKYKGDPTNIVFRSSWELAVMRKLDTNPNILEWSNEEVVIPYVSPLDNRLHRYFVDFWMKYKTKSGIIKKSLIEVKPLKQTQAPVAKNTKSKSYINECCTFMVNEAKWIAAINWASKNECDFLIFTERENYVMEYSPITKYLLFRKF